MPILPFQKNKHLGVHHFEFNYFQRPNNKTTHSRQTEINVARLGWVMSCSASVSHKYSLNRNQVSFTAVRLICQSHKCTTGAGALSCLWNHFRKADFFFFFFFKVLPATTNLFCRCWPFCQLCLFINSPAPLRVQPISSFPFNASPVCLVWVAVQFLTICNS